MEWSVQVEKLNILQALPGVYDQVAEGAGSAEVDFAQQSL